MGFSFLDALIVIVYLVGVAVFGIVAGRSRTAGSTADYFLGSRRIPWWAVCFAIVATETSTLTFISIPGVAYISNLNFLQLTFGYIAGRIIIATVFLPAYYHGELETAYAFLGKRFGAATRNAASAVFMITRLFADGVRLYATAIPIKLITGIDYPTAIAVTALVTLIYTYIGGVRSVIWMDVVQMFIYLGGAVATIIVITGQLPHGLGSVWGAEWIHTKLDVVRAGFDLGFTTFFSTPYTFVASVVGGMFLSMASHGTDHLIVQRLLTTPSLKDGQRAIIVSGGIVMIQFAVFLCIGVLLYAFYGGENMDPNEVFPLYIIHHLPSGVSGLIIAGLLAAAMSTLAGSINSLASATIFDFVKPYVMRDENVHRELVLSRFATFVWCALIIGSAMVFMNTTRTVVELALGIASFTYGGLLGSFLLGLLSKRVHQRAALIGFSAGIIVMVAVVYFTTIAWTWYTVIGSTVTVIVGLIVSTIRRSESHDLNPSSSGEETSGVERESIS
jgi:SSS family solute:Na+ symporter